MAEKISSEGFPEFEYKILFENTGTAMAVIEEDMSISKVNAAFSLFWGSPKDHIEGKWRWADFISDHDLDRIKQYHALGSKDPSAAPGSYYFTSYDKSGMKRDIHLIVSMINGTTKSIATMIDITEKKRAGETSLTVARDITERMKAEEVTQRIGQLAAGIAHEIKNPLAIILQGTEFIKSCIQDELLADCAERIKNSANRVDNIITGLLSYSRQGSLNLDLGDIAEVLNESVSHVNHHLTVRNIKIQKQIETVPPIKFDSNQMKQVFIKLLMNSIESMDSGGPIKIELRRVPDNGKEMLIKISDSGYGIEKESLKKIFDPFFTTKRKTGGTGLGLSITKGIIDKHKGRISVESEIGAGTAISIYLPYDIEQGA